MLKIIDQEYRVDELQQIFENSFEQFVDEKVNAIVGYPGDSFEGEVSWSSELGIWMLLGENADNRYWNAFGVEHPVEGKSLSITCEINVPFSGINRRIAGGFAEDDFGGIYLIHRGKIGGGKKDVGKSLFVDNYHGEWVPMVDGKVESQVALIGALNSKRFSEQVKEFVLEVRDIKSKSSTNDTMSIGISNEFNEEFSGSKKYTTKNLIEANCDHGIIVNTLARELVKLGYEVRNDRNRDLFLMSSDDRINTVFEVKTDITTSSIYSAVGQLLLNNISLPKQPKLILVIPHQAGNSIIKNLKTIGIETITFAWSGNKVVFPSVLFDLAQQS